LGNPAVTVPNERCFGPDDEVRPVGSKSRSGARRESGDGFRGRVDGIHGDSQCGGNFGKFTFSQKVKVVLDDPGFEGILAPAGLKLKKESFGERAGGDSGRVERLDEREGLLDDFRRNSGGGGDVRKFGTKESIFIEVADDFRGGLANGGGGRGKGELRDKMIREGFGKDFGFEEGLAGVESGTIRPGRGDGPIQVLAQWIFVLLFGVGCFGGFHRREFLLKNGIGLKFRLQEGLQFHGGSLEELERLLDLGGDRGRLAEARLKGKGHLGILRLGFV